MNKIKQLEAISNIELAEKAQSAFRKLCLTDGKSFIMDDTDIILSEVIKRFKMSHYRPL